MRWVGCCVLLVMSVACTERDAGSDGTLSPEQYLEASRELLCEQKMRCENTGVFFGTPQECLDYMRHDVRVRRLAAVIDMTRGGTILYDATAATECLAQTSALGCEALRSSPPDVCQGVWSGTLADDSTCHADEECTSGWCDARQACPGRCAQPSVTGGSCGWGEACAWGTTCVEDMCVLHDGPLAEGANCDPWYDWCAFDLYCDSQVNKCAVRKQQGMECVAAGVGQECEQGLQCSFADALCVPFQVVEDLGEACAPAGGLYCDPTAELVCSVDTAAGDSNVCARAGDLGATCQSGTLSTPCDPFSDLYCDFMDTGLCASLKDDGSACELDEECSSRTCQNQLCVTRECW